MRQERKHDEEISEIMEFDDVMDILDKAKDEVSKQLGISVESEIRRIRVVLCDIAKSNCA